MVSCDGFVGVGLCVGLFVLGVHVLNANRRFSGEHQP